MEESFNWLKPIIISCENQFHIDCCNTLLKLFADKYNAEALFATAYIELTEDLRERTTFLNIEI